MTGQACSCGKRQDVIALSKSKGGLKEYLVAGGIAGIVARTCIAPIERVKIIYQIQSGQGGQSSSYLRLVPQIIKEEGILAFWKGNTAAVIRVVPYMSIQFAGYEEYKKLLKGVGINSNVAAGSLAGVTAVGCTYPLDTVRARMAMQAEASSSSAAKVQYKNVLDALITIGKTEGIGALYKGMSATMVGVGPYAGLKFGTYEGMKLSLGTFFGVTEADLPAWMRVGCGSLSGLIAMTFVYPFDIIRRRQQVCVIATILSSC
jgi:hypothetical protein